MKTLMIFWPTSIRRSLSRRRYIVESLEPGPLDELGRHVPELRGTHRIERLGGNSAAEHNRLGDDLGLIAVFEAATADVLEQWRGREQDRDRARPVTMACLPERSMSATTSAAADEKPNGEVMRVIVKVSVGRSFQSWTASRFLR